MEPTHTITLTIELPATMERGKHLTELVISAERYIDRVNTHLGEADSRHEWTSLSGSQGAQVAELTAPMALSGVSVARPDGETLLQYLSAVVETD